MVEIHDDNGLSHFLAGVRWVLEYVQAVKNAITWDKTVVIRKTIGTSQVCDVPGRNYMTAAADASYSTFLFVH